jgi:DNA-binding response OmpR family regulator
MRFLVVEDEIKLANSLKKILENERYIVDLAYDGEEGYERAGVEDYDLLILDLNLPGMDGLEICRRLRDDKVKTPILMLTARDTLADKVKGLNLGADDYLIKPFAFEELLARIRSLLRRDSTQVQSLLTVDDLTLDPEGHTVKRGETNIDVSYKEYSLLEYLMRHSGQVVKKQDLLEHVWGGEVDPFSNVVDVYIGYVRNKIDKAFPDKKPLLRTLKGLGYRIG